MFRLWENQWLECFVFVMCLSNKWDCSSRALAHPGYQSYGLRTNMMIRQMKGHSTSKRSQTLNFALHLQTWAPDWLVHLYFCKMGVGGTSVKARFTCFVGIYIWRASPPHTDAPRSWVALLAPWLVGARHQLSCYPYRECTSTHPFLQTDEGDPDSRQTERASKYVDFIQANTLPDIHATDRGQVLGTVGKVYSKWTWRL